jgi:hypothetical protein
VVEGSGEYATLESCQAACMESHEAEPLDCPLEEDCDEWPPDPATSMQEMEVMTDAVCDEETGEIVKTFETIRVTKVNSE